MAQDPLAALAELERIYDGPIPEPLRRAALLGSAAAARRAYAQGQAEFFAGLVRFQLAAIRSARAAGGSAHGLGADLALYRRERRRWRRRAARGWLL